MKIETDSKLKIGNRVKIIGSDDLEYFVTRVKDNLICNCDKWISGTDSIDERTCEHIDSVIKEKKLSIYKDTTLIWKAPFMKKKQWDGKKDVSGWLMSEYIDGVRAYWDGKNFWSEKNEIINIPEWFVNKMPNGYHFDGEFWLGRGFKLKTLDTIKNKDETEWKNMWYRIYDVPNIKDESYENRITKASFIVNKIDKVDTLTQVICKSKFHIARALAITAKQNGKGVILRNPKSLYKKGFSNNKIVALVYYEDKAKVIAFIKNRKGVLTKIKVENEMGKFNVSILNKSRVKIQKEGDIILFSYNEKNTKGVPLRAKYLETISSYKEDHDESISSSVYWYGEFHGETIKGNPSHKFWSIRVIGTKLSRLYGTIGKERKPISLQYTSVDEAINEAKKYIKKKSKKYERIFKLEKEVWK